MKERINNLAIENATIAVRNFAGKETKFSRAGDRSFCVIIKDEAMANALIDQGWNVKAMPPRNEDEDVTWILKVAVDYRNIAPNVFLVTKKKKTHLDESTVEQVDYVEIKNVDVVISPYFWEVNGKSGIKAYLKTMYVTIVEDEFADKYANIGVEEEDDGEVPFDVE